MVDADPAGLDPGTVVYDADGEELGIVDEVTEDGFEVVASRDASDRSGAGPASADSSERPGQRFGEGYLMWRCDECGEMGELESGMPETCPACGAPKRALYRTQED